MQPPYRTRLGRVGLKVIVTLAGACLAQWACAPMTSMPPPVPMPRGISQETGLAVRGNVPVAIQTEYLCSVGYLDGGCSGVGAETYYYRQFGHKVDLGVTAYVGPPTDGGGGVFMRYHVGEGPRHDVALHLSTGWAWVEVGVPMALKVGENSWVYTSPSVGFRSFTPFRIPLGYTRTLGQHGLLIFEVGTGSSLWGENYPYFTEYFNVYGSAGYARRF